jgi:hypothetical protein
MLNNASVGLGPGHVHHFDTCIKAHDLNASYSTSCQESTVDTTANRSSVWVPAPTATATMNRPAASNSGYFSFVVSISGSSQTTPSASMPRRGPARV